MSHQRVTWAIVVLGSLIGCHAAAAGDVRLIQAVRSRDRAAVQTLLKHNVNVNAPQPDGATALHWAVDLEDVVITRALLGAGARVDATNDYGVAPLSVAVGGRSTDIVEALLAAGANPNLALPTGETVLMTAARSGAVGAVRALLAKGADPNAREHVMGQTALMWAIVENHADIVTALIAGGADVRARSEGGSTPFLFAVREGRFDIVRLLLNRGADVNDTDKEGSSALHVAVMRGHLDIAKDLLRRGADPNAAACGYTVLHWAAGIFETIHTHDYIFNQTAVNQVQEWAVLAGITNQQAKHALITALIAQGANVNARATKTIPKFGFSLFKSNLVLGATPFLLASMVSDVPTMRLLLAHGADPAAANNDGQTALIMAAGSARVPNETRIPEQRVLEAVTLLLSVGSRVNEQSRTGMAPIHFAAMWELHDVIRLLLERGADVNIRNKNGETPLKLANGFEDNVLLFIRPATAALLKERGGTE